MFVLESLHVHRLVKPFAVVGVNIAHEIPEVNTLVQLGVDLFVLVMAEVYELDQELFSNIL